VKGLSSLRPHCLPVLLAGILFAAPLAAQGGQGDSPSAPAYVQLNAGVIGLLNRARNSWRYGVEYRFRPQWGWRLRPVLGAVVAENDARFYFAGLRRDFPLSGRFTFTPGFDVTSYDRGRGVDLGSELEFRTGLEVSYRLYRDWRAGIALYHLSNGGFGDRNPGTNAVVLTLAMPVGD
jgi:hypothetical protein